MSRGIHTKPNGGATVEWLTPPEIIEALGPFDLDPCAHPSQPWATAKHMSTLPVDGLTLDWAGSVWLNPPYGRAIADWLAKLAAHGDGVALVPARTEVEAWFWPHIWEAATAVLFIRGRLYFRKPDGSKAGNAGHGSVLVAYGRKMAGRLLASGIEGKFITLG